MLSDITNDLRGIAAGSHFRCEPRLNGWLLRGNNSFSEGIYNFFTNFFSQSIWYTLAHSYDGMSWIIRGSIWQYKDDLTDFGASPIESASCSNAA